MKSIKHVKAKIDTDRFKINAEMINFKKELEEKLIPRIDILFVLRHKKEEEKRKRDKRRMSRFEGNQEKHSKRIKSNEHMVHRNGKHQSNYRHDNDEPNQKKRE